MATTLDGQRLFDEQQFEIELGAAGRDSIERKIAGLDGVLSIDLGGRSRVIKQRGLLREQSQSQVNKRIDAISAYMDGAEHTLITSDGEKFENLRIDAFRITKRRTSGIGVCVEYEIIYTQLLV